MQYRQLYREISIVVVAKISPEQCNPLFLQKKQVISEAEVMKVRGGMRVSSDMASFKIEDGFEVYCDKERVQVRTEDVTLSDRLCDFLTSLIVILDIKVNAIGINGIFRFGLIDVDLLRFSHRCCPNNAFGPLVDNAMLLDMTIADWNHTENGVTPQTVYNISRQPNDVNGLSVVQIAVNNHLQIKQNKGLAAQYLRQSSNLHTAFFEKCHEFIRSVR